MAFSNSERGQIRKWLGFASIFKDADPQVDAAISAIQSRTEPGGSQPDNSVELDVRSYLLALARLEIAHDDALCCVGTVSVGKIETDGVRTVMMIKQRKQEYIGYLTDAVDTTRVRDVTTPADVLPSGHNLASRMW